MMRTRHNTARGVMSESAFCISMARLYLYGVHVRNQLLAVATPGASRRRVDARATSVHKRQNRARMDVVALLTHCASLCGQRPLHNFVLWRRATCHSSESACACCEALMGLEAATVVTARVAPSWLPPMAAASVAYALTVARWTSLAPWPQACTANLACHHGQALDC